MSAQDSQHGVTRTEVLRTAVCLALITGVAEAAVRAGQEAFGEPTFIGRAVIWMAPAVNLAVFAAIAAAISAVPARWLGRFRHQIAAFLFASLGTVAILSMFGGIARFAVFLLACGVGVQVARLTSSRPAGFRRFEKWATRAALVAIVVFGLGPGLWTTLAGNRILAGQPAAARRSNLLVITLDTVRARSLSLNGYERDTTPNLNRFSRRGVRFDRAISTAPWTLLSITSMLTGRLPHEVTADWSRPVDTTIPILAEQLLRNGYETAGFVANVGFCTYPFGLNRGFLTYEDYRWTPGEAVASSSLGRIVTERHQLRTVTGNFEVLGRKDAATVNDQFLGWVDARSQDRPFFAFLNYFDPHEPYLPPQPFASKFGNLSIRNNGNYRYWNHMARRVSQNRMSPAEVQAEVDAYESAIAYLDDQLGRLFDSLDRKGVLDNTLVIITSDHGEGFGEHGLWTHGNSLYLELIHVPLIVVWPSRVPAGVIVDQPASLLDLAATAMSLLLPEVQSPLPGESLSRFWQDGPDTAASPKPVFSELKGDGMSPDWKGARASMIVGDKHYILNGNGTTELYDIATDYAEKRNLVGSAEGDAWIARMQPTISQLRSWTTK